MKGRNGKLLEAIINNSIQYYQKNSVALFTKLNPSLIIKKREHFWVTGILQKSYCDYYGVYHGKYIEFEAKQTTKNSFYISQIKNHQLQRITEIEKFGGQAFIIIFFQINNKFFAIKNSFLQKWNEVSNKKTIPMKFFEENSYQLKLNEFSRLNIITFINSELTNVY